MVSYVYVVVLQKDDAAAESLLPCQVNDRLYEFLALIVLRVGLPGNDDLYRVFRVVDDALQPIRVPKEHSSPLVGGEAAGKADGQGLRGQDFVCGLHFSSAGSPVLELFSQTTTGKADQIFPAPFVGPPQLCAGYLFYMLPDTLIVRIFCPVWTQVAVKEPCHIPRDPGGNMDAIGYVVYRYIFHRVVVPDLLPNIPGDMAVEPAYPIGVGGESQSQGAHAKGLVFIPRLKAAITQQHPKVDPHPLGIFLEVGPNQLRVKDVIPCLDRGVGGKNRTGQYKLPCGVKRQTLLPSQDIDSLQGRKCRVAFVHMDDRRLDPQGF